MPRKPSPASRTSLYRLTRVTTLADGVQPKYLEGDFTSVNLAISGREALLILGSISTPTLSWAAAVQGLTGRPVTLGNVTAAVLLIRAAGPGGAASGTMGTTLMTSMSRGR